MSDTRSQPSRPPTMTAIALFKFFKALVLFAGAFSGLELARGHWVDRLSAFEEKVTFTPGGVRAQEEIGRLLQIGPGKIGAASIVLALYGALFLVEGIGLWRVKHWAEYLTIVSTTGFIPLEIAELLHKPSVAKWVTLAVNAAIVVYLVARVWMRRHRGERGDATTRRRDRLPAGARV